MKIKDLLDMCGLNDSSLQNVLDAHPLQFISEILNIPVWEIKYKYLTQRNNEKTATKYIFRSEQDWDVIDNEFDIYIERFNELHPDRKLSNVEILEANYLGELVLELE